ncbi:MAG: FecR domain-containing protein [Candidatus Omnitrophica bacterium]|nr:FecR domain-containing protein [Candidatus Omnitrophota bacterium]
MKRILTVSVIFSLAILLLFAGQALTAEKRVAVEADKAVILFMEGDVQVKTLKLARWERASEGTILSKGDNLKTGTASWAEIGFGKYNKNVIRIKEQTLLELVELGPIRLGLLKGEVRSLVKKASRTTTFEIKTPTAVCGARGTGWDTNTDGKKVVVDTYEKEVFFNRFDKDGNIIKNAIIKAGKRGIMDDPLKPVRIVKLPASRIKDWGKWKQNFKERSGITGRVEDKAKKMNAIRQKANSVANKQKDSKFQKRDKDKIKTRTESKSNSTY